MDAEAQYPLFGWDLLSLLGLMFHLIFYLSMEGPSTHESLLADDFKDESRVIERYRG